MTEPIGRSKSASRRFSKRRARSLSVKIPSRMESVARDQYGTRAAAGTGEANEDRPDSFIDVSAANVGAGAHHVLNTAQLTAQGTSRVIASEIRWL